MLAPVVLFTYKRYEHTKKVLDALNKNELAEESELYIFCDGPKKEGDRADVEKVHQVVNQFLENSAFKKVHLTIAEENSGLAKSVIRGVTKIMNQYGMAIVVEDDLITAKDFLQYMNAALAFYRDNKKIWSISGYSFFKPEELDYNHDIYMGYRGCSWGWATWKDRWDLVDWDVKDYKWFKINPFARKKLAISGNDLPAMLDLQMHGHISSWAVRWCHQQSKLGLYTVFPKWSRVRNIGLDGSGTHSGKTHNFNIELHENLICRFEHLDTDPTILRKYKKKFDKSLWVCIKAYIKHVILGKK